ncbi:hypothetical protein VUR80DRAFT_659 [Thermomyces stellatus]
MCCRVAQVPVPTPQPSDAEWSHLLLSYSGQELAFLVRLQLGCAFPTSFTYHCCFACTFQEAAVEESASEFSITHDGLAESAGKASPQAYHRSTRRRHVNSQSLKRPKQTPSPPTFILHRAARTSARVTATIRTVALPSFFRSWGADCGPFCGRGCTIVSVRR